MFNKIKDKITFAAIAAPAYAQADRLKLGLPSGSNFEPLGGLTVGGMISGLIGFVMIVAALVFFFILLLGGIKWITSEGDEKKVASARAQITNGLIGLAIIFASFAIMKLIEYVFGISIMGDIIFPTFQ